MNYLIATVVTGIGATALMDLWSVARKSLFGIAAPDYGMVGRWLGHMPRGRFFHHPIAASPAIASERLIGWTAHYLTGIMFALMLVGIYGTTWLDHPQVLPALLVGLGTVAAPFLIMQPGMGAGVAASRAKRPAVARLQSIVNHAVFGAGLYVSGLASRYLLAAVAI
jgi:hypothetical protein